MHQSNSHNYPTRHSSKKMINPLSNLPQNIPQLFLEKPFSRKSSVYNMKDKIDIEKIMVDIKITPTKNLKIKSHIEVISRQLNLLKEYSEVQEQIRTVELLIESIQKKLSQNLAQHKEFTHQKTNSVSPIKHLDDLTSRILYTNFNLKNIQETVNQQSIQDQIMNSRTPIKVTGFLENQNQEIDKLNEEISLLSKMLKLKSVENSHHNSIDSRSKNKCYESKSTSKMGMKQSFKACSTKKDKVSQERMLKYEYFR